MMSTYNYLYALSYVVFKVQLHFFRHLSMPSGDEGIRTPDPLLARQVLSQLSYTPIPGNMKFSDRPLLRSMGLSGLEPPTSRLSGVRSNRLSYKPLILASTCFPMPSPA